MTQQYLAKTHAGLEPLLAEELKSLLAFDIEIGTRAVSFKGNLRTLYRANLECRTAIAILLPLTSFEFNDVETYYDQIHALPWHNYIQPDQTFIIKSTVHSLHFRNSQFGTLKCKDAIVDRIRQATGERPNIDKDNANIYVDLYVNENQATISLDASGESLHKRRYRKFDGHAPLNEVLAAGLLKLSGWNAGETLINPMCGVASLLIEADRIQRNIPAQISRKFFPFQHWSNYDEEQYEFIQKAAKFRIQPGRSKLIGFDIDKEIYRYAVGNTKKAGSYSDIDLSCDDFFKYTPPPGPGTVIINPPYDERIKMRQIKDFYFEMGRKLEKDYENKDVWIFSYHTEALNSLKLEVLKEHALYNGSLKCKYVLVATPKTITEETTKTTRKRKRISRKPKALEE